MPVDWSEHRSTESNRHEKNKQSLHSKANSDGDLEQAWILSELPIIESRRVQVKCYDNAWGDTMVVEELPVKAFVKIKATTPKIFHYDKIIWFHCEHPDSI